MKKLSCIIVDDEPVARSIIHEFVSQTPSLLLAGEFENTVKAGKFVDEHQPDLIFLDIEMPRKTGLDWLKSSELKPMVILTTAFPQYAIEGYELDIIDYLLKPISFVRFTKAVEKAREFAAMKSGLKNGNSKQQVFVRTDKRIEKLNTDDILYIESIGNYVNIVTAQTKLIAYLTLKSMETQLSDADFVRIHYSYLVNFSKISSIEGNLIHIKDVSLPISRGYKEPFMKLIEDRLLKR